MTEEISQCNEVEKILEHVSKDSLEELEQRIKISSHLKDCGDYNCYLIKVDRINKGLY